MTPEPENPAEVPGVSLVSGFTGISAVMWLLLVGLGVSSGNTLLIGVGANVFGTITLILIAILILRAIGRRVKRQKEKGGEGQTEEVPSPSGSVTEDLERLWALHKDGALTQEEFEVQKQSLLKP